MGSRLYRRDHPSKGGGCLFQRTGLLGPDCQGSPGGTAPYKQLVEEQEVFCGFASREILQAVMGQGAWLKIT
jgi:hypothetical protein